MNEIIESLYNRKSVRVYEEKAIPNEMKNVILEAAMQAPTAGCQQLYTILDITDQNLKEALAESCDHQMCIRDRICTARIVRREEPEQRSPKRKGWNRWQI